MSAEAKYFRVGLFVFSGMLLIGSFAVILGGRGLFQDSIVIETYFTESVAGLEIGSPVRLRGVPRGKVSGIGFVADYYALETDDDRLAYGSIVVVKMEITETTDPEAIDEPERVRRSLERSIAGGLRMRLASNPLTGTAYIEADFLDPKTHVPMEIGWTPRRLYIPSAPSTIATISSAAERIFTRLEHVEVEKVVENLDKLLVTLTGEVKETDLPAVSARAKRVLDQLEGTLAQLRSDLRDADVAALAKRADAALDELNATLAAARGVVEGGKYDLTAALDNLRVASENLRDLTDTARSYPSLLILGEPPAPSPVSAR